jgi:hypothetical protein
MTRCRYLLAILLTVCGGCLHSAPSVNPAEGAGTPIGLSAKRLFRSVGLSDPFRPAGFSSTYQRRMIASSGRQDDASAENQELSGVRDSRRISASTRDQHEQRSRDFAD